MHPSQSLFDRWIARPRRRWPTALVAVALFAALPFASALDGTLDLFLTTDAWRLWLFPTVIAYILAVAPLMGRIDRAVQASFRAILEIPQEETERLFQTAGVPRPAGEMRAVAVGALLGYLSLWGTGNAVPDGWLEIVGIAEAVLMYAMLAWVIYLSLIGSRLMRVLHRQPLRVDPFDVTPFEAIGRQGLVLALVFVGGITLSILFVGFRSENVRLAAFFQPPRNGSSRPFAITLSHRAEHWPSGSNPARRRRRSPSRCWPSPPTRDDSRRCPPGRTTPPCCGPSSSPSWSRRAPSGRACSGTSSSRSRRAGRAAPAGQGTAEGAGGAEPAPLLVLPPITPFGC